MNKAAQKPDVSVAHVVLETDQMEASCQFMRTIGMRSVFEGPDVSVFELRGGTHLLLMAKSAVIGGDASFDLMVDDIHTSREKFSALAWIHRRSSRARKLTMKCLRCVNRPVTSLRCFPVT